MVSISLMSFSVSVLHLCNQYILYPYPIGHCPAWLEQTHSKWLGCVCQVTSSVPKIFVHVMSNYS